MPATSYGADAPRYEFRVFGPDLGALRERIEALGDSPERNAGEEVYLLAPDRPEVNVKIRDGRLELKRLEGLRGPLERWRPELEAPEPFPPSAVRAALEALGAGEADGSPATAERLVARLSARPEAWIARLSKERTRWRVRGGLAEHARVSLPGAEVETVAAEAETAAETLRLVSALGLTMRRNVSYPRFLAAALAPAQ